MSSLINPNINNNLDNYIPKYYDVGVNITDSMFNGNYHGKIHHRNDILDVLKKAFNHHVNDILLTGSSLSESKRTLEIIKFYKNDKLNNLKIPNLYLTIGVHPCTVLEFENNSNNNNNNNNNNLENYLLELENLINYSLDLGLVKAFGEIGLDYDRLNYTPIDKQLFYFEKQLNLSTKFNLPLFLHMRSACDDFIKILKPFLLNNKFKNKNLLIHSFTGNKLDLEKLLNLEKINNYKIFISLNGASLRDNLTLECLNLIPLNRLMIETDSPWCEIKKTHPSYKYITKSPNIFYPCDYENLNLIKNKSEIKQILNSNSKKNLNLSLNEFLPIPIVKSDKFDNFKYNDLFIDSPLIKSRNEPCLIGFVAEVISKVTNRDPKLIIDSAYKNSKQVFG